MEIFDIETIKIKVDCRKFLEIMTFVSTQQGNDDFDVDELLTEPGDDIDDGSGSQDDYRVTLISSNQDITVIV